MLFSSIEFLFIFLPIFLILYYIVPAKFQNSVIFIGSLIFYGLGEPTFTILMFMTIVINYFAALLINKFKELGHHKLLILALVTTLSLDFGTLLFFKYTNFLIDNINHILKWSGETTQLSFVNILLPLGISFYTFQIVSYVIDVYKGVIEPEKNFIDLGAYISMFPQLIAGPIVIYSNIKNDLKNRIIGLDNLEEGLKIFIVGLGYKVILANRIGTLWNDVCMFGFESISTPLAWIGALAYSFQLYFDFCGYSLMAVGLGKMIGFELPKNFDHPYEARSVTQFWRKWHITLGLWFKEYVYIPLGGNRKGKTKTIRNLLVVWFLVGLWHGASWNFIIWGLMIFVFQGIEKLFVLKLLENDNIVAKVISHIYVWTYILISWTIFAITDLSELLVYLSRMFPFFGIGKTMNSADYISCLTDYWPLLICCFVFSLSVPFKLYTKIKDRFGNSLIYTTACLGIFWYAIYFLSLGMSNPFLYFRF